MKTTTNFWLGSLLVFLLDFSTKIWALNFLPYDEEYLINSLFSLHRIFNQGTIMLFYDLPYGVTVNQFRIIWILVALLITIAIRSVINSKALKVKSIEGEFAKTGLYLLMGSVWGNLYDRIFRPEGVVDFIRLNFLTDSIPILNIADIVVYLANLCFIITWLIIIYKGITSRKTIKVIPS